MSLSLRFKLLYPKIIAIALLVTTYSHVRFFNISGALPLVDLMVIYYWCIYCPEVVPNWFVFVMGIFRDLISSSLIGVSAILNLVFKNIVIFKREKLARKSFLSVWYGFFVFSGIAVLLQWLQMSFILDEFVDLRKLFIQFLASVAIYPFFHVLFNFFLVTLPKNFSNA